MAPWPPSILTALRESYLSHIYRKERRRRRGLKISHAQISRSSISPSRRSRVSIDVRNYGRRSTTDGLIIYATRRRILLPSLLCVKRESEWGLGIVISARVFRRLGVLQIDLFPTEGEYQIVGFCAPLAPAA